MHKLIEHIENNIIEIEEGFGSIAVKGIGAVGGAAGGLAAIVTREKSNWNKSVKDHNIIREKLKTRPNDVSLKKQEQLTRRKKATAYLKYEDVKNKYKSKAKATASHQASNLGKSISNHLPAIKDNVSKIKQAAKNVVSKINPLNNRVGSKIHNYVTSNFHR